MRPLRVCLVLALLGATAVGAEITTDKEVVIKDVEVVSVTARNVVYKVNNKQVTRPIKEILKVDYREPVKPAFGVEYAQIDLTDGTILLAKTWAIKGEVLVVELLSGPRFGLPIDVVRSILATAHNEKDKNDWRNRVINTRGKEALVIKKVVVRRDKKSGKDVPVLDESGNQQTTTFNLPVKFGDGDEKGQTIEVVVYTDDGVVRAIRKQSEIHGLIYKHALGPKAQPVICTLTDVAQNVVMVSRLDAAKGGGVSVTTPAGAKMDFKPNEIAQIDYTRGRLDFLSALVPARTAITPNPFEDKGKDGKWYVYHDSNLDSTPIRLSGASYRQGLTILSDTEITWNLGGAYRQFEAVIGIDDATKAEGEVMVTIYGNNKEVTSVPIVSRTVKGKNGEAVAPPRPTRKVTLNVKGVFALRIAVKSKDELNGLSIGVSLGDAKVIK